MISANAQLNEQCKIVVGLAPVAPSTSVPRYVSLKGYDRCTILVSVKNGSTVTGSAITVKQASAVANTGEKALAFTTAKRNLDPANTDTLSNFTVSSNTFTTDSTNSLQGLYVINVQETDLDIANSFDCIRLGTGDSTNATVSAIYILYPAKFGGATPMTAITD